MFRLKWQRHLQITIIIGFFSSSEMVPSNRRETQAAPQRTRKQAATANKACVLCRLRKVKCDAAAVGIPCSNCVGRECAKDCVLPVRKGRTRCVDHPNAP